MKNKVLVDENKRYEFDFSASEYVLEMHDLTNNIMLSDVDFITETDKEVLFIEYKNASIEGAVNPNGMLAKIKGEDFYKKIARKYYDSLLLFWACKGNEKELPITYVLLIEHPIIDKKLRKQLKLKIANQLPFKLKEKQIQREVISNFEVYNLEEWKEKFPQIKITPVVSM
jgi:hypothetical protein